MLFRTKVKMDTTVGFSETRTTPASVVAADRKLERLAREEFLTADGKNWLVLATDPFHDERVVPTGFPDVNTTGSVVQTVSKTVTVSNTTGTSTGAWDAHIVLWPTPLTYSEEAYQDPIVGSVAFPYLIKSTDYDVAPNNFGGLTAQVVPTGTPTISFALAPGAQSSFNLDLTGFASGIYRVVGMGVEVHDTTAELYKQGSVTCYRISNPTPLNSSQTTGFIASGTVASPGPVHETIPVKFIGTPPTTVQEAKLVPDSKQWEAKKGAYAVATLSTVENPPVVLKNELVGFPDFNGLYVYGQPVVALTVNSNLYTAPHRNNLLPFNTTGLYFTGLHASFSLTVNVVWYVEKFPTLNDQQLLVLTKPSPAFDQMALDIYSGTMSRMPVAVPVNMNPLGEWFEDVVNDVAGFAAPALAAAGLVFPEFAPVLEPLAAGVGTLKSKVLEPRAQARRAKRKKKRAKAKAAANSNGPAGKPAGKKPGK
jgi:hypothetical protein